MKAIESLASVTVAATDPAGVAADYERLLSVMAVQTEGGFALAAANIDVEVRAVAPGEAPGLRAMTFGVCDPARAAEELSRCGIPAGDGASGLLDLKATHGVGISLTQHRTPSVPAGPAVALDHVVIRTDNPERAIALYGGRLGLDMRLDRTNPAWKARLIFFRCGDLVVEIVHGLERAGDGTPDAFGGLSWRVPDIEALHARLEADGVALSPIRPGRRPGSRVCTVRERTGEVPTILMGLTPRTV